MEDPTDKRNRDERRLTALKVGAVGLTVAGLGVFAGLAAAGTDDGPAAPSASTPTPPGQTAADAARIAEDDSLFDDQAQPGAVGDYDDEASGDDDEYADSYAGDDAYGHDDPGRHHGHHGSPAGPLAGGGGSPAPVQGAASVGPQGGQGSYAPSRGSTGGS